jgi:iron complex outermembrane receptor protein
MSCSERIRSERTEAPGRIVGALRTVLRGAGVGSVCLVCAPALAMVGSTSDLKRMSLDELMNVEITSVSRSAEGLQGAAAAVAVVTNEDIQRSGATSIPEALRSVPGLHVVRRNASAWAVSARGFTSSNSEKMLVLSDTRSLYTPLFSGVAWDVQEYLLSDIERIEVIRGPGAALWGSNAVNGVINITTKDAADTQGVHIEALAGTEETANVAARYGGRLNDDVHYRVFAKHAERDDTYHPSIPSDDRWRMTLAGFRSDWTPNETDSITLQGKAYRGEMGMYAPSVTIIGRAGPTPPLVSEMTGGHVLGRWQHRFDGSEMQLRFYYDRTHRKNPSFDDDLDTYDLDLQHRFQFDEVLGVPHDVTWGLNYRYTQNKNVGKVVFALDPYRSDDSVFSAFVQDQIALREDVRITLGSKFEYNDFSGFELQPSLRAAWDLNSRTTLWGAMARAARVPTRLERDVAVDLSDDPTENPTARLLGNAELESEELTAYEIGVRWRALPALSFDVAAFHHRYDDLMSLEIGDPVIDPRDGRVVLPVLNQNLTRGKSQGFEALVTYVPLPSWHLTASYTYIDVSLEPRGQDVNRGQLARHRRINGSCVPRTICPKDCSWMFSFAA